MRLLLHRWVQWVFYYSARPFQPNEGLAAGSWSTGGYAFFCHWSRILVRATCQRSYFVLNNVLSKRVVFCSILLLSRDGGSDGLQLVRDWRIVRESLISFAIL
jgi:hypothetical protein